MTDDEVMALIEIQKAQSCKAGATDAQIETKWRTLGEGWQFVHRDAALMACLQVWARSDWTLEDVAAKYDEHQLAAVGYLLEFNPQAANRIKALWPIWRQRSQRIEDDRWYQASEALRICEAIHYLHGIALRLRAGHDMLHLDPSITVTVEQAKALGFDV